MSTLDDARRGRLVDLGAVELWVDDEGSAEDEAVILLGGSDAPGFRWSRSLVDRLRADGFRVVRFDHRDCGRSTRIAADAPYRLDDMVGDVIGLAGALGIDTAHLVGYSMGGMIGQLLALDHADFVRSLTLIGSSPAPGDERLGGPDDAFVDAMTTRLFAGPPRDDEGRVRWIVELEELLAGSGYPVDTDTRVERAAAEVATGWVAETGHGVAVHASPARLERLPEIDTPTLVVHGGDDPVFPPAHGRALATRIDGAVLIEVDGLGHEVPDALIEELWPVLQLHLAASSAR